MATTHISYIGLHTLDLTPLQGKLVDIEEGGMQGLRTDQPGFQTVALALAESMPLHGTAAGIPQDVHDHFLMCNATVATIDELLATATKQVEVLRESRAFYIDARQNDIGLMVDAMRSRAQRRKDPSLLVPFEQVIKYNGQIGEKAASTRKKNEQAKADLPEEAEAAATTALPEAGALAAPAAQPVQPQ